MVKKLNESNKIAVILYGGIFLFALLCNYITVYIADDFTYLYSFADNKRIENILQIIPSMAAHAHTMNGRLVAHGLVQLFAMLPSVLFDMVNALVFTMQIFLIDRCSRGSCRNNAMAILVFCVIWLLEPAFGQVNLWQDGAVNYLWSIFFGMLYLKPFVDGFLWDKRSGNKFYQGLFLPFAFLVGAYSETVSAAVIFMAMLLTALQVFYKKEKLDKFDLVAIIVAFAGYVSIYLAPAQWQNKSVEPSLKMLMNTFINAVLKYETFGILMIAFAVMLIWNIAAKADVRRMLLAGVFLGGSLAANFIMVLASYYPDRSAVGAFIFLLAADAVLFQLVWENSRYQLTAVTVVVVLTLVSVPRVLDSARLMASDYFNIRQNENYILECRENGVLDVEIPVVVPQVVQSALYDSKYLDTKNAKNWPNNAMARYYGVDSIIGYELPEEKQP